MRTRSIPTKTFRCEALLYKDQSNLSSHVTFKGSMTLSLELDEAKKLYGYITRQSLARTNDQWAGFFSKFGLC